MALTKVSRGLLSTGIVDNSNATAITLNADESATFAGAISVTGTATMGGLVTQATANTYPAGAAQIKSLAGDISYITNVGGSFLISNSSTTDQFTLSSAGAVGIGTSSPNIANFGKALTILDPASSNQIPAIELAFGSNTRGANIAVDNRASVKALAITAVASDLAMTFGTNNTERMRIDGGTGNLLVGTNTTNIATEGTVIYGAGNKGVMTLSSTNMTALYVNRSTYGELVQFRQGGSTVVGSIGSFNGVPYIGYAGGAGGGIMFNGASIEPTALGSSRTDGANDIGSINYRWKDLYLSGGVYLGGAGAANKLDDYETGNWTPTVSVGTATLYLSQWYVKVGSLVTCYFYIYNLTQSTGTASVVINGLPFPKAVNHESYFSVSYGGTPSLPSNVTGVFGRVGQNGTNSIGLEIHRNAATSTVMTYAHSSGSHFAATFSYRTSA